MSILANGSPIVGAKLGGADASIYNLGNLVFPVGSAPSSVPGLYSPRFIDATPASANIVIPAFSTASGRSLIFVQSYSHMGVSGEVVSATVGAAGRTFNTGTAATLLGNIHQGRSNIYAFDASIAAGDVEIHLVFQSTPRALSLHAVDIGAASGIGNVSTIAAAANNAQFTTVTSATNSEVYYGLVRANASGEAMVWTGSDVDTGLETTGGGTGSSDHDFSLAYKDVPAIGAADANCAFPTSSLQHAGIAVEVLS